MFASNKLNLRAYFWVTSPTRSILSMPLYFLDDIILVWRNFYLRYQTSAHVQEFSKDTFSLFFLLLFALKVCSVMPCRLMAHEREENKDDFQLFHFNGSTEWQDRNQFTLNQQEITGWFSDLLTFHISLFCTTTMDGKETWNERYQRGYQRDDKWYFDMLWIAEDEWKDSFWMAKYLMWKRKNNHWRIPFREFIVQQITTWSAMSILLVDGKPNFFVFSTIHLFSIQFLSCANKHKKN